MSPRSPSHLSVLTVDRQIKQPYCRLSCPVDNLSQFDNPVAGRHPAVSRFHTHFYRIIRALEVSPTVSYIVDSNTRFLYTNPAWDCFAESNGAPQLVHEAMIGTNLFDCIPNVLKAFYSDAFAQVLKNQGIWEHSYECSSPELFRKYRMRIHLLKGRNWFLLTNPLIFERAHERANKASRRIYFEEGVVMMCAHCRCSRRVGNPDKWDFVPAHLRLKGLDLVKVSHGLCSICQAYFHPTLAFA